MGNSVSGIVTRCPLVLKLKKAVSGDFVWKGRLTYRNTELQLQDPSQVEREIYKGKAAGSAGGCWAAP